MSFNIINDTAEKLFANECSKELIAHVEQGYFADQLWHQAIELGFTAIFSRENFGGIESNWVDAFPVFYHLGYYQVPLPIAETAISNFILSAANIEYQNDAPFAIATLDQCRNIYLDDQQLIHGEIQNVKWARNASFLLCALNNQQLALIDLNENNIRTSENVDISKMPSDTLYLKGTPIKAVIDHPFTNLSDPIKLFGACARAIMMVGALEFTLDQSVQYAKDRIQFGKPIGSNQAIQQQLALMAGELAIARASAMMACKDMPNIHQLVSDSSEFSVAGAKVLAGEAVSSGTSIAHQVHGAIGFTYEHALNFATRRLWVWRGDFGNATEWAKYIGRAFAQKTSAELWDGITERKLPNSVSPINSPILENA